MSVLGLNSGYTIKYNPLPSGVPSGLALRTVSGKGLYLTVYPSSCPNTDTVLVVISLNTLTADLDNETVSWENIGKGGKERRQTLTWLQAQWHWCQAVGEVLSLPLVYSGSPGRAAGRLLVTVALL